MENYKLIILFVILNSVNSFGYEPDKGHEPLINTALKVYSECVTEPNLIYGINERKRIIQGDLAMDKGLKFNLIDWISLREEGVFTKKRRIFNWHFYNPERISYSKVGLIEQSHSRLWGDLIKGINKNNKEYNKLLFLGGIIHLIEDLTVPAHVIPVYHGPTAVKHLGPKQLEPLVSYMQNEGKEHSKKIADKIDSISPDITRLEKELLNNKQFCLAVQKENLSLTDIRLSVAQFTLEYLKNEIPNCPGVKWQDFWIQPTNQEYFGRYNVKGENPLFGEAGVLLSSSNNICTFNALDDRYLDFVYVLHKKAIEADLKILFWGTNNI